MASLLGYVDRAEHRTARAPALAHGRHRRRPGRRGREQRASAPMRRTRQIRTKLEEAGRRRRAEPPGRAAGCASTAPGSRMPVRTLLPRERGLGAWPAPGSIWCWDIPGTGRGRLLIVAGVGLPRKVLSSKAARRQKKFTQHFADAIDVIVRGIRSGLPVGECLNIIARESPEPVGYRVQASGRGPEARHDLEGRRSTGAAGACRPPT